jgi:hypothetical protein
MLVFLGCTLQTTFAPFFQELMLCQAGFADRGHQPSIAHVQCIIEVEALMHSLEGTLDMRQRGRCDNAEGRPSLSGLA